MKTLFTSLIGSFLFTAAFSQTIEFSANDYNNPGIFEKNQTRPHALLIPYNSNDLAKEGNLSHNDNYLSLDGTWRFKWVENPDLVPEDFYLPDAVLENWDNIKVPSNWQMEGFGYPKFRNVALSFKSDIPNVPKDFNPTGCYVRTFEVDETWKDRQLFLRFEGVKSASYVWINGERVGYNQGGFEPAEYDVTNYIKPGENHIAVQVMRFCDGSYIENQDMWRLSGIFRSVYVYATPKVHVRDYYVVTDLDEEYKNARLKVELDVANFLAKDVRNYQVEIQLEDHQQQNIFDDPKKSKKLKIQKGSTLKVQFDEEMINPKKWSAEKPNLYVLTMRLFDDNGKLTEVYRKNIGFKEIELVDNVFLVNGKPVKFNGVNSHMHHPDHGQAVPVATLRKDMELMKQFNINAVRTSHYPPSPEYLDLADEYGMYIIDEVNDECHSNIHISKLPEYKDAFVDRSRKLVYRDRNHPSIVMWSAGNEAGVGDNLKAVIEEGKKIDPSRPMWMYGGNTFFIPFEDVTGPRYWIPLEVKKLAESKILSPEDQRPSFMDEYLAATGNGIGGLDEYWELIYQYPRLTGGAIWDWISPGITEQVEIVPDRSPNRNDGALLGVAKIGEGKTGKGLELSGHDDWLEFYQSESLDISGDQLTVDLWLKPQKIEDQNTFITKGNHQFGLVQEPDDSLLFYVLTNPIGRHTFYFVNFMHTRKEIKAPMAENWYGEWHHLAGIYDGETISIYVDGKQLASASCSGSIINTPFPVCVGRDVEMHDQGEYSGQLSKANYDNIRIFNKALTIGGLSDNSINDQALVYLDFEELKDEGSFYFTGLGGRKYGIVWPDRSVQPELWQIKKSAQPLKIEAMDLKKGTFTLWNRTNFTNSNEWEGSWKIWSEEMVLKEGKIQLDVEGGEKKEFKIEWPEQLVEAERDTWLEFSFKTDDDKIWAKAGHEVAWDQFLISEGVSQISSDKEKQNIEFEESDKQIIISGEKFSYTFDKESGRITSIVVDGSEILEKGPELNVWRATMSNDNDPWGSWNFQNGNMTKYNGSGIFNQWMTLGLNKLDHRVDELEIAYIGDQKVEVFVKTTSYCSGGWSAFENEIMYQFYRDGTVDVDHAITPLGPMPDHLPKIGVQFNLKSDFSNLQWYGRGPFETYPDRKTGAKVGVYNSTVPDEYVPYLMPQDHGNKTDVKWVEITNAEGIGVAISSDDPFNFRASEYSTDHLTRALYPYQLKRSGMVTLDIDYETTGVGETATRTLTKYRVYPNVYHRSWKIQPVLK